MVGHAALRSSLVMEKVEADLLLQLQHLRLPLPSVVGVVAHMTSVWIQIWTLSWPLLCASLWRKNVLGKKLP